MATVLIDVPDALIPDLTQAIALRMQGTNDTAIAPIVAKVVAGQATSGAEKQALASAFMKAAAKDALLDYRAQLAAVAARRNASDPAVSW